MHERFFITWAFFYPIAAYLNAENPLIFPGEERYFKSLRQLTFHGVNSEAYFSFHGSQITFQSTDFGFDCDQIFRFTNVTKDDMSSRKPKLISTGLGRTTCSYFLPDDQQILYASTHAESSSCPLSACSPQMTSKNATLKQLCQSLPYIWDIYPSFDIYVALSDGVIQKRLTFEDGYDAEGTVSPKGDLIVYTSMASGDLNLWTMGLDGSRKRPITKTLGYEGGAFFSPDGRKLIFRAYEPKTRDEIEEYKKLLAFNLVSPLRMELYEAWDLEQENPKIRRITNLGGSNWAPFYFADNCRVIFSSNFKNPSALNFQLYAIDTCGSDLKIRQITNGSSFNAFPMFSPDGRLLIFASNRNGSIGKPNSAFNLVLAEWKNKDFEDGYIDFWIIMCVTFCILCAFFMVLYYRIKLCLQSGSFEKLMV